MTNPSDLRYIKEHDWVRVDADGLATFGITDHAHPDQVSLVSGANSTGAFDLKAAIPKLTMPVLIVTGDCDPNLPSSRDIASKAQNAKLVELANVGHGSV